MLDSGEIVEFDEPYLLLKKSSGVFHHIVDQTGPGEADRLLDMAREAFESRHTAEEIAKEEERTFDEKE